MGRAKLEYDDSGSTFYYFLLSFYALILLPITYFLYPRRKKDVDRKDLVCQCEPCLAKKARLDLVKPNQWVTQYARYAVLVLLWGILVIMIYKVLTADKDYVEYDPFEILQLDPEASMSEIRKQYRKLSKIYHPDKQGGNQDMFMKIAKAYEALTDEVSRENWKTYGNPDGPQAASFGIALPAWIVEKQNSLLVLAVYMGLFMIVLPSIVGVWWYKSIKYGSTNVLIQTSQLFAYFLNKNRTIPVKRLLMILTAAMEFNREISQLVPSRPSDNVELTKIILSKALPHVCIKTKERFLCLPYAVKARILLHAHLERYPLHSSTLESDQRIILSKCPQLLQEMINVLSQLWAYQRSRKGMEGVKVETLPSLDLFEEVMRASGIIVQAMWITGVSSVFLQLPHLSQTLLRHFRTKKRNITTIQQLISLSSEERRSLLRTLSDEDYSDLVAVCVKFPRVTIKAETQVVDDDDTDLVTVGSVITLSVMLKRTTHLEERLFCLDSSESGQRKHEQEVETLYPKVDGEFDDDRSEDRNGYPSSFPNKIKKGKKGAGFGRKVRGQTSRRKTVNPKKSKKNERIVSKVVDSVSDDDGDNSDGDGDKGEYAGSGKLGSEGDGMRKRRGKIGEEVEEEEEEEKWSKGSGENEGESIMEEGDKEEEEEWHRLQQSLQKHSKKKFEALKTESPPVHAPYFHEEKYELWWLYVADRKRKEIICPPKRITGLMEDHMTELHFTAPDKPGQYRYTLILRSDSYIDLCFSEEVKLTVGAHKEVSGREQWADLEKEEEDEEVIELSEGDSWNDDEEEEEESD